MVDKDGNLLWEYVNVAEDGYVYRMNWEDS